MEDNNLHKFQGFKPFKRRQSPQSKGFDVNITSAYIGFSMKALSQLGSTVGDRLSVAAVDDDKDPDKVKIIIAATVEKDGTFEILSKKKIKSTPIIYSTVGRLNPEYKGGYYLKRFGEYDKKSWWELVREDPNKIKAEQKLKRKFRLFPTD